MRSGDRWLRSQRPLGRWADPGPVSDLLSIGALVVSGRSAATARKQHPRSRIVVATQPRWLIQAGTPSASRSLSARVGAWPAAPGSPPGLERSSRPSAPSGPAPGACRRGRERTPTRRAPNGVVAKRQLPCRARVPPHATLPGRGAPCVQLRGDLRPGEASASKPDDPLTDLLGHRPPTSHTPIVPLRLEGSAASLWASSEYASCASCQHVAQTPV
jgi:hypothetical protein